MAEFSTLAPPSAADLGVHGLDSAVVPIGTVERETRLAKDTLRIWERRYGFPQPDRDALGERLYPAEQVLQLQHIKRLLDGGHRPGAVVGLPLAELQALGERPQGSRQRQRSRRTSGEADVDHGHTAVLDCLRRHDLPGLRHLLSQAILRSGVERFVCDHAAPLAQAVGAAWAAGQLQVFEEHLFSEALESLLRQAISGATGTPQQTPRVLLSTPPDEPHRLGLLMAETIFVAHGCTCMNLGPQTPLRDIVLAQAAHRADIVALSITLAMPAKRAQADLQVLRRTLPPSVQLWVGTAQSALHRHRIDGVHLFAQLGGLEPALAQWREAAARA
jgi:MerR family transcriptional regulator, light-induced transcriptional regulator